MLLSFGWPGGVFLLILHKSKLNEVNLTPESVLQINSVRKKVLRSSVTALIEPLGGSIAPLLR